MIGISLLKVRVREPLTMRIACQLLILIGMARGSTGTGITLQLTSTIFTGKSSQLKNVRIQTTVKRILQMFTAKNLNKKSDKNKKSYGIKSPRNVSSCSLPLKVNDSVMLRHGFLITIFNQTIHVFSSISVHTVNKLIK